MIAVPIGPRAQRFIIAAAPAYLDVHGRPTHPKDLLNHACIRHRFASGVMHPWEFERDGEIVKITPNGPVIANGIDLEIAAAIQGLGLIATFEEFLVQALKSGALEPVLEDWLQPFSGPFLYYPSRRHMPAPLRAFVDFIKRRTAPDCIDGRFRLTAHRLRSPLEPGGLHVGSDASTQVRPLARPAAACCRADHRVDLTAGFLAAFSLSKTGSRFC